MELSKEKKQVADLFEHYEEMFGNNLKISQRLIIK